MEIVRNLIQKFCDLEIGNQIAIIGVIVAIIVPILIYRRQKKDGKKKETRRNKEKANHYLTALPMEADSKNVIGRKKDLRKLWKTLSKHPHTILTGFGGIGKTKLAQLLFHEYERKFDEVAWIDYQGNLKDSILACINMHQEIEDKEKRWTAVVTALNNDQKKKLFIIDNVDHTTSQHPEQDKDLRDLTGWKNTTVLLTSRLIHLSDFENIVLEFLELENCVKVFKHYYKGSNPNLETIVNIVKLANWHTMTIELLAKGVGRENLDDYYQKLVANGFEMIDRKAATILNERNPNNIAEHLKILFNMQQRSEEDKKILNSFAILPEKCQCTLAEVEQWLGFKDSDLDEVIKDGWLSFDKESEKYYLHPLVRTIIRFDFAEDAQNEKNLAPKGTADKILDYFADNDEWYDIANGYVSLQRLIGIVEAAMGAVAYEGSERFGSLYHNLGYINYNLGAYDKALEYYEKAVVIREKIQGTEHPDTATTYNNIGNVYINKSDYDKALEYYFKALPIVEKNLGPEHPYVAATYNNIGSVYWNRGGQGDYDKALEYYKKALKIDEKVLGKDHPDTATDYNNIGSVYWARGGQGDFDKALEYCEKALKIDEKVLGKDHPGTATDYNNIGFVYYQMKKYREALNYLEKALQIQKPILGDDHPDTKNTQGWIDLTKAAMSKGK